MPTPVMLYKWDTTNVTNADVSIGIFRDGTSIFANRVKATSHTFFYSAPDATAFAELYSTVFYTNPLWLNGDATTAVVGVTELTFDYYSQYGQLRISTGNTVEINKMDATTAISTYNHAMVLPYGASLLRFTAHDATTITAGYVSSVEKVYDTDPYTCALLGRTLPDSTGVLQIYVDITNTTGGVDCTLYIDVTTQNIETNYISLYASSSRADYTAAYYLGRIDFGNIATNGTLHKYQLPAALVQTLSNNRFYETTLSILHNKDILEDADGTYLVNYAYVVYIATTDEYCATANTALIYDSTTLLDGYSVVTGNSAQVHSGTLRGRDFFVRSEEESYEETPVAEVWTFLDSDTFSYLDWNIYEEILSNFGRFFHSPLMFNTVLPEFVTMSFVTNATTHGISSIETYCDTTVIFAKTSGDTDGFSITSEVGNLKMNMYNPKITPDVVIDGGYLYKLIPTMSDGTCIVNIYKKGTTEYEAWSGTNTHPFAANQTFFLSVLLKR